MTAEQATLNGAIASEVKASLFRKFFQLLESKNVPYAVLSNYFAYPEQIHSDIDFVVPETHRRAIPALLRQFCAENDARLIMITEYHNISAFSCTISVVLDSLPMHLRFDVCSDDYRREQLILPWQFMLEGRRRSRQGFFVPAPEKSLLHYLLKRIEKRSLGVEQLQTLHRWHELAPSEADELITAHWPESHNEVRDCIAAQIAPSAESLASWSKHVHFANPTQSMPSRAYQYFREMRRRVRRVLQPTGLLVCFLGPDGCGKSTAISGAKAALHPPFSHCAEFHLLPRLLLRRRNTNEDTTKPHEKIPRGAAASMAKILLWFVDLTLGYWVTLRPKLVRSTLVIFDRYIHDLQIDRIRYRYSGPQWWAQLLAKLSPQPDLWILLEAPVEVLWRRKAELSKEESARQIDAYRALISRLTNACIINADQASERVVADICSAVFRRMESRTAKRYRLLLRESL